VSLTLSNPPTAILQPAEPSDTQNPPDPDANKYFHEPGGDDLLHHYDIRYFQKIVTDDERQDTLRHLIRAYLLTFEYLGLETWIAHGTLLAWYWNGKILPWDWDLDTQVCHAVPSLPTPATTGVLPPHQVTDEGLKVLGKHYNQTFYDYDEGNGTPTRRYFLDVNAWAWQRDRGDGANVSPPLNTLETHPAQPLNLIFGSSRSSMLDSSALIMDSSLTSPPCQKSIQKLNLASSCARTTTSTDSEMCFLLEKPISKASKPKFHTHMSLFSLKSTQSKH